MFLRYSVTVAMASAVTFGLFYFMQALIHMDAGFDEAKKTRVIEFVRLKRDETVNTKERQLPDRLKPEEPPPPPDFDMSDADAPDSELTGIASSFDTGVDLGGPQIGGAPTDGDVVPLVRVEPTYPIRAAERGIEGWVEVKFDISKVGTVQNAKVIGFQPSKIFNKAALRAIRRWKYKPKVEDGVAVVRTDVSVRLAFTLEDA